MNDHDQDHDVRLEEVAAYAIGALDPEQVDDFRAHLETCERCQSELRWFAPAVQALPEAVERRKPSPEVRVRLMAEVRADAAAEAKRAKAEQRRERAETGTGFGAWVRGLRVGGLTWKPLTGMAAALLVVAVIAGYAVGTGGGSNAHTTSVAQANGIEASVVSEGDRGELHLANVAALPEGKVLEAWVMRGKTVEPVQALFAPDHEGNATTTIDNLKNVSAVLVTREPAGGTKMPTTEPIVEVPLES
jgi:anti-sigma-K factor RskA